MTGLTLLNEFIFKDEGKHVEGSILMYKIFEPALDPSVILEMIVAGVDAEKCYIESILPEKLNGMNAEQMIEYICFLADNLLVDLDCERYYNIENPFPWMQMIDLPMKKNIHEKRVAEYEKPSKAFVFNKDADF